jgi:hypothetical protein
LCHFRARGLRRVFAGPGDADRDRPAGLQLGDNGGDSTSAGNPEGGNKLEITSNSSVFGSTLKGIDDNSEKNKLSTSKVTGAWDREWDGGIGQVENDFSSSFTGTQNDLSTAEFEAIAADAVATSAFWAGQPGTSIDIDLNSGAMLTVTGVTGGANIYTIDDGFIINSGSKLTLTGGVGDYFVFNVPATKLFSIQSNSIIELGGDIEAEEVLFNVLGNISGPGPDDALIGGGSIFQGTLLAPGRKVEVTQNHYYTFDSGGFMGTGAPETTPVTAAQAIAEKEANDSSWGGLWGQIIAGGAINFTESDISHHPFMTMPPPVTVPEAGWSIGLFGIGVAGLGGVAAVGRRRRRAAR